MSSTAEEARQKTSDVATDDIRAMFNDILSRTGRPLSQMAPETGVPYGTLHAWSKSTYKGNNERISRQISAWMTTREARERAQSQMRAAPPFTMTKTASRIWEVLEFAQAMPDMVLISADAGIGKTTAIKAYAEAASNVWLITAQPVHGTSHALLHLMHRAMRMEGQYRASEMSADIQAWMYGKKGLLIIDEAQFLPPPVRDQLRSTVFDGAGIGVALVGNEDLRAQFSRERLTGKNAQLFSRIGLRFTRVKPLKEDVQTLLDAWGVDDAKAREAALGIAMKPGANRVMTKVLTLAFGLADARGDESPNLADVETAWQQLGRDRVMGAIDRAAALATRMENRMTRDEAEGIAWWNAMRNSDRASWCELAQTAQPAEAWRYFKRVCAGIRASGQTVEPGAMFDGVSSRAKHLAWMANWMRMAARANAPLDVAERHVMLRAVDEALGIIAVSPDVGKRLVSLLTMLSAEVAAHDAGVAGEGRMMGGHIETVLQGQSPAASFESLARWVRAATHTKAHLTDFEAELLLGRILFAFKRFDLSPEAGQRLASFLDEMSAQAAIQVPDGSHQAINGRV